MIRLLRRNRFIAAFLIAFLLVGMLPEGFINPQPVKAAATTYTWTRVHDLKELMDKTPEGQKVPILLCYSIEDVEYFVQGGLPKDGYYSKNKEADGWNYFTAGVADTTSGGNGVRVTREKFVTQSDEVLPLWFEYAGRKVPEDKNATHGGYYYSGGMNGQNETELTLPTYYISPTDTDSGSNDYRKASSLHWCYLWTGQGGGNTYMYETKAGNDAPGTDLDVNGRLESTVKNSSIKSFRNTWFVRTGSRYDSGNFPIDEFHIFNCIDDLSDVHLFYGRDAVASSMRELGEMLAGSALGKIIGDKFTGGDAEEQNAKYGRRVSAYTDDGKGGRFREAYFKIFVGEEGDHLMDQDVDASQVSDTTFTWKKVKSMDDLPSTQDKAVPILVTYTANGEDYFLDADYESYRYAQRSFSRFFSGRRIYADDDIDLSKDKFETTARLKPLWFEYSGTKTVPHNKEFTDNLVPATAVKDREMKNYRIYASDENGAESSYRLYYYNIKGQTDSTLPSEHWGNPYNHSTVFLDYYDSDMMKWDNGVSEEWAWAQMGATAENKDNALYSYGDANLSGYWQVTNARKDGRAAGQGNRDPEDPTDEFMIYNPFYINERTSMLQWGLGISWKTKSATQVGFVEPGWNAQGEWATETREWRDDSHYFTLWIGQFTNEQVGGESRGKIKQKLELPQYGDDDWWEFKKVTSLKDLPDNTKGDDKGVVPIYMVFERMENEKKEKYLVSGYYNHFYADEETNSGNWSGFEIRKITSDSYFSKDQFITHAGDMYAPLWIQWAGTVKPVHSYYTEKTGASVFNDFADMKGKLNQYYIYANAKDERLGATPSTYRWDYIDIMCRDSYLFEADPSKYDSTVRNQKIRTQFSHETPNKYKAKESFFDKWCLTAGSRMSKNSNARNQFYFFADVTGKETISINHKTQKYKRGGTEYEFCPAWPSENDDGDSGDRTWMDDYQLFDIYIGTHIDGQDTLAKNEVIESGKYVEYKAPRLIPQGSQLTIEKGATLVVSGILQNNGIIRNKGGLLLVKKGGKILSTNGKTVSSTSLKEDGVLIPLNGVYIASNAVGDAGGGDMIIYNGGNVFFPNGVHLTNSTIVNKGGMVVLNYCGSEYKESYMFYMKNSSIENHGNVYLSYDGTISTMINHNDWSSCVSKDTNSNRYRVMKALDKILDEKGKETGKTVDQNTFYSSGTVNKASSSIDINFADAQY